jgi:hypothetical protein
LQFIELVVRWLSGEWLHSDGFKILERAALRGIGW